MGAYIYLVGTPDHAQGHGITPLMALTSKKDLIEWVRSSSGLSSKKRESLEYFRCEDSLYGKQFVEIEVKSDHHITGDTE